MSRPLPLLLLLLSAWFIAPAQTNSARNLMPVPVSLRETGDRFILDESFRVSVTGSPDSRLYAEASRFVRRLGERTGIFLDKQGFVVAEDSALPAPLRISVRRPGKLDGTDDETYAIGITGKQVRITAATDLGAIHGLETLLQLVSTDSAGYYFPGVAISDTPRFAWRGLLLDVVLHFMPPEIVRRTIDGMAAVKMNVLHLHLSNDQGFRVESKVFPRLNAVASEGKFYTQEEVRALIRYADQRGIRIVPEFVVPAHTTAILTAFPALGSRTRQYRLERYFGVFDPVLDPTNEQVWVFLDKLFTEMTALFPDPCFHIGGDENTGKDWESNPRIRAYMAAHGMKTFEELQTAFIRRLLPLVEKHHKTMMGWDEIFQPGVPKSIIIQSWRGKEPYYASLKNGYRAILSQGYYIDLIQPASYHYLNDPAPDSADLNTSRRNLVLGGEATMWSELVSPETVDSRIWPRTAAIAERLWSPRQVRDTDDMYRRLDIVAAQLSFLGLRHEAYEQTMLERLANGGNPAPLAVLVKVIEPLKIYERNQGDTLYTVFSPLTKLADAATPDPSLPRIFRQQVQAFLAHPDSAGAKNIAGQLTVWKNNHARFLPLLAASPQLQEAAPLSEHLAAIAAVGLAALDLLTGGRPADAAWINQQTPVLDRAREQSGRCTLEVVDPIAALVRAVAPARSNP